MNAVDQINSDREKLLVKSKKIEAEFAAIFECHADHEKAHTSAILAIAVRAALVHLKSKQRFTSTLGLKAELAEAIVVGQQKEHGNSVNKDKFEAVLLGLINASK
ncbi:hypothetical protein MHM89_11340 [Pseudoalteromonas sp. CNC9-20]|uniref:hypothetical protein n=1 Tax=Pseudoalteromonas sp. CNC9-20 TaxID=2917750 RepID=UPI001EF3EB65|nr:hypothetical protein [Pseudoalteromonas sp. CNC9-20]MCG7570526.1 hypothetical protein [Pseudoalteromonas sp. CNC9-20]